MTVQRWRCKARLMAVIGCVDVAGRRTSFLEVPGTILSECLLSLRVSGWRWGVEESCSPEEDTGETDFN